MDQRGIADLAQFLPTPIKFWATGNEENGRKCEGASASLPPPPLVTLILHLLGQPQYTYTASPYPGRRLAGLGSRGQVPCSCSRAVTTN